MEPTELPEGVEFEGKLEDVKADVIAWQRKNNFMYTGFKVNPDENYPTVMLYSSKTTPLEGETAEKYASELEKSLGDYGKKVETENNPQPKESDGEEENDEENTPKEDSGDSDDNQEEKSTGFSALANYSGNGSFSNTDNN